MSSDPRADEYQSPLAEHLAAAGVTFVAADRLAALETVAEAASHRRAMGKAATKAISDVRAGMISTAAYNKAMAAKTSADSALDAALDVLEASDG